MRTESVRIMPACLCLWGSLFYSPFIWEHLRGEQLQTLKGFLVNTVFWSLLFEKTNPRMLLVAQLCYGVPLLWSRELSLCFSYEGFSRFLRIGMSPCLLQQNHGRGSHGFGWWLSTPPASIPPTFATSIDCALCSGVDTKIIPHL